MGESNLVQKIRQRVRLSTTSLDEEILDLIDEVKADLKLSGVCAEKIIDNDPLILRAISTYCRAYYETDNVKASRLQESYEFIKQHLTISLDYTSE